MNYLTETDPQLYDILEREANREESTIELIASENFTSKAVMEMVGGVMTNKYAEGYPGRRYYGGCEVVDEAENMARDRLKKLFGAEYVNVQPHSGSQANMAVFMTFLKPGDLIMGLASCSWRTSYPWQYGQLFRSVIQINFLSCIKGNR